MRFTANSTQSLLSYIDADLRYRFANASYEAWFGIPADQITGMHVRDVIGNEAFEAVLPYMKRALTGNSLSYETLIRYGEGVERYVKAAYTPDEGSDGKVRGFAVCVTDLSDQKKEEDSQRFLVRANQMLASSLDYEQTLSHVAQMAVEKLADWCVVSMVEEGQERRRIALTHRDPSRVEWAKQLEKRYPSEPDENQGEMQVIRTREPMLYPVIDPAMIEAAAKDEEHLQLLREAKIQSAMIVPIYIGQESMGAISFISSIPNQFGDHELQIAQQLASRAGLAIQNARLYQAAQIELDERKRVEMRLRKLIDQSPLSIQTFSPDGRCTFANASWEQLWGAKKEALENYNVLEDPQLKAKGLADDIRAAFAGEVRRFPVFEYEPGEPAKPGRARWISAIMYPIQSKAGVVQEVVLMVQDVTSERQAREDLVFAQERFRHIVNSSQDAVITIGTDSIIQFWDGQSEAIFGWTRAEALGKKLYELIIPEQYRSAHVEGLERYLKTGENAVLGKTLELSALRKGGQEFPVELAISEVKAAGQLTFTAFVRDITERKQVERDLLESRAQYQTLASELEERVAQRTRELKAANGELEAFSYSVSHDLRTPLRSISSFAQLLTNEQGHLLDEDGKDSLARILESAKRMSRLIDDLLQFARLARVELRFELIDMSKIAESIIDDLQVKYPERSVRVTIQPGMTAFADPGLFRVSLENLIENAWKFTSKVDGACIEFGSMQKDGEKVYFVRDNGAGFNMKYANKLFKPFERLHADSEYPGTGIGLVNVQKIIQRHGGRIWAEGEIGKGATFSFTLRSGR
jgi:PAS domain S-box-containing protein